VFFSEYSVDMYTVSQDVPLSVSYQYAYRRRLNAVLAYRKVGFEHSVVGYWMCW